MQVWYGPISVETLSFVILLLKIIFTLFLANIFLRMCKFAYRKFLKSKPQHVAKVPSSNIHQ